MLCCAVFGRAGGLIGWRWPCARSGARAILVRASAAAAALLVAAGVLGADALARAETRADALSLLAVAPGCGLMMDAPAGQPEQRLAFQTR